MSLGNSTSNSTCNQINLEGVYRSIFQCQDNKSLGLWGDERAPVLDSDPDNGEQLEDVIAQNYENLVYNCSMELASECPHTFCMEIVGRGNPELAGIGVGKPTLELFCIGVRKQKANNKNTG
jgi:hypothetical protein